MRNWLTILSLVVMTTPAMAQVSMEWALHVVNADSPFEAAGIGDIDGDGVNDILSGEYVYLGPDWKAVQIATLEEVNEYHDDFASELMDIDGDGDLDTLSCTWFSQSIFWRENTGMDGEWPVHVVDKPGNMETGFSYDVDGDGRLDFVPNINVEVAWYRNVSQARWIRMPVGTEGAGHGLGVGDVDGNGITDFITPKGWYRGKAKVATEAVNDVPFEYIWEPDFTLGATSIPMLVHDVNADGFPDIVYGLGHDYGVFWLEQVIDNGKRTWKPHTIDDEWSQAHYLIIHDLNEDGHWELITGKRHRAHNGRDPGGTDPVCVYMYHYNATDNTWTRSTLSEGGDVGFGLNADIGDIDGDGDLDIVCPGKSGLYWFEQL